MRLLKNPQLGSLIPKTLTTCKDVANFGHDVPGHGHLDRIQFNRQKARLRRFRVWPRPEETPYSQESHLRRHRL
jgi:hypothetical protein